MGLFSLSILLRSLQGLSLGLVVSAAALLSVESPFADTPMLIVAMGCCAAGVSTAADRWIAGRIDDVAAGGVLLMTAGCGLGLCAVLIHPLIAAAVFGGLAVTSDWSSASTLCRRGVKNRNRWQATRVWLVILPTAAALAVSLASALSVVHLLWTTLAVLVVTATAALTLRRHRWLAPVTTDTAEAIARHAGSAAEASSAQRECEVQGEQTAQGRPDGPGTSDCVPEECEEVECCGGAAKPFERISFGHSVLIASCGALALWGILPAFSINLIRSSPLWTAGLLWLSAGIGYWLLVSAARRTGYTVAQLPFLVVGVPAVILATVVSPTFALPTVAAMVVAVCSGAIIAGCGAIVSEMQPDCSSDPVRTRVAVTALLAASAVITFCSLAAAMRPPTAFERAVALAAPFMVLLWALRKISTPMLASAGMEDDSPETQAELREVMSAMQK